MINKVLIGILVFLVILSGALGAYSYTLSNQINALSEHLAVFQDEFVAFEGESITRLGVLEKGINGTLARIGALEDELSGTQNKIGTLEGELSSTLARIGTLDGEIKNVAAQITESGINTISIYQGVSQAVVRISNGHDVIGSGFIIDDDAHVVTAYHVVESLSEIDIILPDGSFSAATVIGSCKYSDIAVLKLEEPPVIAPLTLTDSDTVRVGEPVVTIGNPFEQTESLTAGIVSQINVLADIDYATETRGVANLIQFDAAVNFGNSGCPLLNSEGEVIGLVIARVNPQEGDGIYYAVSSNKLKRVAASLIDQGSFDYPWIGAFISNLTPQLALNRELGTINGVVIVQILTDSPAEAAGIEADDIIVTIDGVAVRDTADFISYLGEHTSLDDTVSLTLIRDSTQQELSLKIGKRP